MATRLDIHTYYHWNAPFEWATMEHTEPDGRKVIVGKANRGNTGWVTRNPPGLLHVIEGEVDVRFATDLKPVQALSAGEFMVVWWMRDFFLTAIHSPTRFIYVPITPSGQHNSPHQKWCIDQLPCEERPVGITLRSLARHPRIITQDFGYEWVSIEPNTILRRHRHHSSHALVIVTHGYGWCGSGAHTQSPQSIAAGQWTEIHPNAFHGFKAGAEGMSFVSIQVPPIGEDYEFPKKEYRYPES